MSQFQTTLAFDLPYPAFLAIAAPAESAETSLPVPDLIDTGDTAAAIISLAVDALEQPGDSTALLRHLQERLVALLSGFERRPGLEAAADDLYRAAAGYLRARDGTAPPSARVSRLLRDAAARLQARLAALQTG